MPVSPLPVKRAKRRGLYGDADSAPDPVSLSTGTHLILTAMFGSRES